MNRMKMTIVAGLMLAATHAAASVDTSTPPGGVYRLKPGIYVAAGADCTAPANAAIRQYDGHGLGTAHTHACKATVRTRRGRTYTVDQSCIDAGTGPAPRFNQRQQVVVHDALNFTQTIKGAAVRYAYCPVDQLPPDLKNAVNR